MASFCDEVSLTVSSGKGGDGSISFRREKFIPKGGPDGGDGGRGGDIIFRANPNLNTLSHIRGRKFYTAENGERGHGKKMHGKDGEHYIIDVPVGTLIQTQEDMELIKDLSTPWEEYVAARGGRGGYGNAHFATATRRAPDFAEIGDIPETHEFHLELKLIADVGIIGIPSAGKSTLISVISNARPKIADYPFTTLIPNLGVCDHKGYSFLVSDIPGLIEGASEGKGLGHEFLKHIERCALLLHVLDGSHLDKIVEEYKIIQNELHTYSENLSEKKQFIVVNKIDVLDKDLESLLLEKLLAETKLKKKEIFFISAASHQGLESLLNALVPLIKEHKSQQEELVAPEEVLTIKPLEEDDQRWWLDKDAEGKLHIYGKRVEQIARMSDLSNIGAQERMYDVLEKKNIMNALGKTGLFEGDPFYIAGKRMEYRETL
ncbi:MAG: GTPase ObgE [Candidatus Gracilibacteria bacterium]